MKLSNLNDLGKKFLVEDCQQIDINLFLKRTRGKLKEILLYSEIEADGLKIGLITSATHYKGLRYWFKCPLCGRRVGKLYKQPINQGFGCRACLNLEYRSRRYGV